MSFKESTNQVLMQIYKDKGLSHLKKVAYAMLQTANHKGNKEFRTSTHGEICECVLLAIIHDYMKNNSNKTKDWVVEQGLILKDPEKPNSEYLTELDVTLFTPQKIFVFECKSFAGSKIICDKCTIKREGKSFDVFAQNYAHGVTLLKNMESFRQHSPETVKEKPIQLVLFNFSIGDCKDIRDLSTKSLMPCVDDGEVEKLFAGLSDKPVLWQMLGVSKAVKIIKVASEKNRKQHLEYVKSLHRK